MTLASFLLNKMFCAIVGRCMPTAGQERQAGLLERMRDLASRQNAERKCSNVTGKEYRQVPEDDSGMYDYKARGAYQCQLGPSLIHIPQDKCT